MKPAILEVQDLAVSFDGVTVLNGLSLRVEYGEIRFLIGPNGAGKTTLLDAITGKVRPVRGRITFDGQFETLHRGVHEIARRGIGRKFQSPSVFASLTVQENVEIAASGLVPTFRLLSGAGSGERAKVRELLATINLEGKAQRTAGELSHGEKQWLEIGMLLVQEPKLLLLDEPVAGMTRAERDRTGLLLQTIRERCSILVVEHDMHFVRQFSATVTVLHGGRVLTEGPMSEVQSDERVIDVYLGRKARAAVATPSGAAG